jgi:hypothetical protein
MANWSSMTNIINRSAVTRELFVGVPCYGGMVSCLTVNGLLTTQVSLFASGLPLRFPSFVANESLVTRARNRIVAQFLATTCSHLLFVDADIGFTSKDVDALVRSGFEVVGGAYPQKTIEWRRVVDLVKSGCPADQLAVRAGLYAANRTLQDLANGTVSVIEKNDGRFVEVQDVATGFLLIKRDALLRYIARYEDEIAYTADYSPHRGETHYDVFGVGRDPVASVDVRERELLRRLLDAVRNGQDTAALIEEIDALKAAPGAVVRYLSEDYFFSRRWQAMGGQTFVALDCKLSHIGAYVFEGDVDAAVRGA